MELKAFIMTKIELFESAVWNTYVTYNRTIYYIIRQCLAIHKPENLKSCYHHCLLASLMYSLKSHSLFLFSFHNQRYNRNRQACQHSYYQTTKYPRNGYFQYFGWSFFAYIVRLCSLVAICYYCNIKVSWLSYISLILSN